MSNTAYSINNAQPLIQIYQKEWTFLSNGPFKTYGVPNVEVIIGKDPQGAYIAVPATVLKTWVLHATARGWRPINPIEHELFKLSLT